MGWDEEICKERVLTSKLKMMKSWKAGAGRIHRGHIIYPLTLNENTQRQRAKQNGNDQPVLWAELCPLTIDVLMS